MNITYQDIVYAVCGKDNPEPIGFSFTELTSELVDYFGINRFSAGISWAVENVGDNFLTLIKDLADRFYDGDYGEYFNETADILVNHLTGKYTTDFGNIWLESRNSDYIKCVIIYFDFEK